MWFPYTLPARPKPESQRENINKSLADQGRREFLIGFYLQNPVSREWQVELHLRESHWEQDTVDGEPISIEFYPQKDERLAEVLCRFHTISHVEAVRHCYGYVARLLSTWSASHGRGLAIAGFRVADLRHEARWRALPHWPSALEFAIPQQPGLTDEAQALLALYREVRTATSPVYRFLCAYKILAVVRAGVAPFDQPPATAAHGRVVTQEMLALSGLIGSRPELEGLELTALVDELASWREWGLAYTTGTHLSHSLDEYSLSTEIDCLANLVDLAAHHVLRDLLGPSNPPIVEDSPSVTQDSIDLNV